MKRDIVYIIAIAVLSLFTFKYFTHSCEEPIPDLIEHEIKLRDSLHFLEGIIARQQQVIDAKDSLNKYRDSIETLVLFENAKLKAEIKRRNLERRLPERNIVNECFGCYDSVQVKYIDDVFVHDSIVTEKNKRLEDLLDENIFQIYTLNTMIRTQKVALQVSDSLRYYDQQEILTLTVQLQDQTKRKKKWRIRAICVAVIAIGKEAYDQATSK